LVRVLFWSSVPICAVFSADSINIIMHHWATAKELTMFAKCQRLRRASCGLHKRTTTN
jgi:hypothetical protein